ncbi:hypothetical protein NPIL_394981 [Nephila pilipes]|uniref:Uncharacterized protein n=1 Tax=Nephila pilipes TaxID=299642 RepID=A0A8X6NCA9_NEPPI|nr:hypothetical protein NPIL_394981 [Nephila pilipes]
MESVLMRSPTSFVPGVTHPYGCQEKLRPSNGIQQKKGGWQEFRRIPLFSSDIRFGDVNKANDLCMDSISRWTYLDEMLSVCSERNPAFRPADSPTSKELRHEEVFGRIQVVTGTRFVWNGSVFLNLPLKKKYRGKLEILLISFRWKNHVIITSTE